MTILGDAIRAHSRSNADALAIDGGQQGRLSWRRLAQDVEVMTTDFLERFDPARPVAVALDQGIMSCLCDLALLEAGIPALQLPLFFTEEQREHAIRTAGAQALIGRTKLLQIGLQMPDVIARDTPRAALPDGTAKISFTSGSTGTPKGVCLSADHLLGVAISVVDYVGAAHAGRHLALLPPGILLDTVAGFYATLLAGGTYVALPQIEVGLAQPFRPDFAAMLGAIAEHRITSLILVPELLAGLVGAMEQGGRRLPYLTLVAVGGACVPNSLIERANALNLPVRQGYGLTECASVVTLEDGSESAPGGVGRSLGLNTIGLADDAEIVIDGPLFLGTIGEPRAAGPYFTGDIGVLDDDGRLRIIGRKSNLIITGHGRNIAPEWVESVLTNDAAIAQAMVHGDGEASLGALIVPASATADIEAAMNRAQAHLPLYAQVGNWHVVAPFTPANGLLTGNGRLRRSAIAATYLTGDIAMNFFDRLVAETAEARAAMLQVPQLRAGLAGDIELETYIVYLTQAFHHVRHTVPLMLEARRRLSDRPILVAALDDYIEEETGHEAWILNDIEAAGGDREEAAKSDPLPGTAAMVDHAYRVIRTGNPAAFFGMVFVLEGTSVAMASQGAEAVKARLALPDSAFSYLTSHGALDLEHMRFFATLMNQITDAADQEAIIAMAEDMFGLFGGMFAGIPMESLNAAA